MRQVWPSSEDLRERARQEIERFGWSDAKSEFPWVNLRDRQGNLLPVDRRNIEIVSAVAWTLGTFCMKNEAALTGEWEDATSMSIDSGDRPTVRYTIPYAAYDEFESRPDPGHRPS